MAQAQIATVKRLSYEEFLEQYAHVSAEWVDGEVLLMAAATADHELLRIFLLSLLTEFVKLRRLGTVLGEPYNMKLSFRLPGRSPDVLFVANENLTRVLNQYLDGPADLIVEVVSLESRRRDRVTKFGEYERAGVREYWIVDPKRKESEFYLRDANGKYQRVTIGEDSLYRSAVLAGFWLKTDWLWQRPLPTLIDVLKAWEMI